MTSALQEVNQLLLAQRRQLQGDLTDCLNYDSEGPTKTRKLAHLEGEITGLEAALHLVEAVGSSELARVL